MYMKDIVLVNAQCRQSGQRGKLEHLGLGYLASTLLSYGYQMEMLDANFNDWTAEETARRIQAHPSRVVGFSVFLNNVRQTLQVIEMLKSRGDKRHITLGGHHPTFNYEEILANIPGINSIIIGEGEITLLEMMKRLSEGRDWTEVPGIAFRDKGGKIIRNACQPLISNLDSIPFPYREPYADHLRQQQMATVLSSRGCYGACSFCSIRSFYNLASGKPWRARSAKNVVDEIEDLVRRYGIQHIEFVDDNLIGTGKQGRERARSLGEEIIRRGLHISFLFICRANDINEELLFFLKKAGLSKVDIGVESWIPSHLAVFNKKLTVEDNRRAIDILKKLELANRFYLVPSNPYASIGELCQNMAEVEQVGLSYFPDPAIFNRLVVFKGSPIEERLRREGMLLPSKPGDGFKGPLEYEYLHSIMKKVHRSGEEIYLRHLGLKEKVTRLFSTSECNSLEKEFVQEINLALYRAAFYLFKDCLEAFKKASESSIPLIMSNRFQELEQGITEIEKLHTAGKFHSFTDIKIKLGIRSLAIHPDIFASLLEIC